LQQAKIETKRNDNNLMTKQIKKTDLKTSWMHEMTAGKSFDACTW
jgi:hypothetical protein